MEGFTLIRKRYVPYEEIDISDDEVVYLDDEVMITAWEPINPRNDMKKGKSFWYFDKSLKISYVYDHDDSFVHYYCDIARYEIDKNTKTYKVIDLLLDLIIKEDLTYEVMDLDELADARKDGLITDDEMYMSLMGLNNLLRDIKDKKFPYDKMKEFDK